MTQPGAKLRYRRQDAECLRDVGGEGKPAYAFGPRRGGENPSVRAGPSPLPETRTKNRRATTYWKTSTDRMRIGMELANVRLHRSYPL
jgi:hypothetical protein